MNGQVALELYIREIETGFSGLELQTIVTCRSAEKKMQTNSPGRRRTFGSSLPSRLNWRDIDAL